MAFDERSYSGKIQRVAPDSLIEDDLSFGAIATPWGNRAAARKVIDTLKDFILSSRQDQEATSPFQKLTCLSPMANNLRVAMMLANDLIYREDNKAEYTAGVEVVVFSHYQGELSFAQVGYPLIYLARKGMPWIPLSVQIDLACEMSESGNILPPLPQNMIGLHTTTNMNIGSFRTQPGDRLVLLSHSLAGHAAFIQPFEATHLDGISSTLAAAHPELPFWLGVLDFP